MLRRHRESILVAAVLLGFCGGEGPCVWAGIIGQAKIQTDFDSFRVRRIGLQIAGTAENAELAIPESAMLPKGIILDIRRKGYEVVEKPVEGYPPAGTMGITYGVTRASKGSGTQARFEITLKGQIVLRAVQKNAALWQVESSATQVMDKSERLPPEVIEKLVTEFYNGVFATLPKAPRYKMVVGAPYHFPSRLTTEPVRPPRDTISAGRIMREIQSGRCEGAPKPICFVDPGGGDPIVQMWNDSDEQLTVCWQGVTDMDLILAPNAKFGLRVAPGAYQIGARTAAPEVVPFRSDETLQLNKNYSIRFSVSEEGY